ncbi:molybdenum cofactor cytidylyltransferase [bacterium]|nr:molybdenum cofactor cytidylyltransferase [bacterium]
MNSDKVWAVVLAAGKSRRMGEPKLLLPFKGQTIIERVLENILASRVQRVVVVVGATREKIERIIQNLPVQIIYNPFFHRGMLSSVQRGIDSLPLESEAALVFLGDQPSIPPEVVNRLVQAYSKTKSGIVIPVYQNRRGHPLLIDLKYREEVKKLDSPIGLKGLVHKNSNEICEVEVKAPGVLRDIDDREDYRRELKRES